MTAITEAKQELCGPKPTIYPSFASDGRKMAPAIGSGLTFPILWLALGLSMSFIVAAFTDGDGDRIFQITGFIAIVAYGVAING